MFQHGLEKLKSSYHVGSLALSSACFPHMAKEIADLLVKGFEISHCKVVSQIVKLFEFCDTGNISSEGFWFHEAIRKGTQVSSSSDPCSCVGRGSTTIQISDSGHQQG